MGTGAATEEATGEVRLGIHHTVDVAGECSLTMLNGCENSYEP